MCPVLFLPTVATFLLYPEIARIVNFIENSPNKIQWELALTGEFLEFFPIKEIAPVL